MAFYSTNVRDDAELSQYVIGFPKGQNSVQDPALIDDRAFKTATNIQLVVDGVERRYGTTTPLTISGSKVWASAPYYKKTTGSRQQLFIANGKLHYRSDADTTITTVSSPSFANADTCFVQARDKMFIYNGSDRMRYWDGSAVTEYTQLSTPTGLAVTASFNDTAAVSGITRSSSTATLTSSSAHGRKTGDYVIVSGATQTEYNGRFQITVTSATTFTYTVSGTPATPATGTIFFTSGGATTYSYRVSAFNASGETLACTPVTVTNAPDTLTTLNFNKLTWNTVSGATGYNIYGRKTTGLAETYLQTVYELTYTDTGADPQSATKLPPDANNTGGVVAKFAVYTLGRQFAAGVTEGATYHPTRLYYSGTAQYIDSFAGGEYGGGWVDVYPNDGGEIVGLYPYQNSVLVFKTNGIFKFYFTSTGLPALLEITKGHGGTSWKAIQAIDNDIVYVGQRENRLVCMTIGQQENYVGDQLRTNNISIFIDDELSDINRSKFANICSFYYDYKFTFSFSKSGQTENQQGWVLDTRFGGWVEWDGPPMKVTQYVQYDDGSTVHLYGCMNDQGKMVELMQPNRNDSGASFRSTIATKQYTFKYFDIAKIWRNPTLWFKYISFGQIAIEVFADGNRSQGKANLSTTSNGAGLGVDLFGTLIPGSMSATMVTGSVGSDVPKELQMLTICRSLSFTLVDEQVNSNWLFMGLHLRYALLDGKPLEDEYRVEIT